MLTPLAVDPGHPFPYVSDLSLNLAGRRPRIHGDERELFARVKVPEHVAQMAPDRRHRSFRAARGSHRRTSRPAVSRHGGAGAPRLRVTRNADLSDALDEADDLLSAVEYELRRRRFGRATRLEVGASMTDEVLDLLIGEFDLDPSAVYVARTPLDPTSFNEIADIERPALRWPEWKGVVDPRLQPDDEPVDISPRSALVMSSSSTAYESFSRSIVEFIHQAANDPDVLAIKITLYRTASSSPIVDACIKAAEQGKQVAVLVELKARFDEAANIEKARRLEQAGVHVAYGLLGLKIHTKIAMAVREEPDGIRRYCHIGTGNYNHRTARIYEDIGILTADPEIGADVADLFNHLTGYGREIRYNKLLVAPDQLRPGLEALIDNEIASGRGRDDPQDEQPGRCPHDREALRGITGGCRHRPDHPRSVQPQAGDPRTQRPDPGATIGRYLEHSRIYHFANGNGPGEPATYIGSADLMSRNLNRRVEALVRLDDPRTQPRA